MKLKAYLLAAASFSGALGCLAQTADELLERGRAAFLDYRFDDASRLYAQAAKKAKRNDTGIAGIIADYESELETARGYLERVEKITVIDSIALPKDDFFKSYRLPSSAGLLSGNDLSDYSFSNENEDYRLWASPDSTGTLHIMESARLNDGSWSAPNRLPDEIGEGNDAILPFMMPDGVTLYYAGCGENSIGGYDIMVAVRDPSDGSFMQPSNLGFPYNSPYDDYLLAIDELNGVGWFATDRNQLGDDITVYVFLTNEMRVNYPAGDDGLESKARLADWRSTQPEGADYTGLLGELAQIVPGEREPVPEFTFQGPGGRIYRRYDELPGASARKAMRRYLSALADKAGFEEGLSALRKKYAESPSHALAGRIAGMEAKAPAFRSNVDAARSELCKSLK